MPLLHQPSAPYFLFILPFIYVLCSICLLCWLHWVCFLDLLHLFVSCVLHRMPKSLDTQLSLFWFTSLTPLRMCVQHALLIPRHVLFYWLIMCHLFCVLCLLKPYLSVLARFIRLTWLAQLVRVTLLNSDSLCLLNLSYCPTASTSSTHSKYPA